MGDAVGRAEEVRIAMLGSGFVATFYMQGLANVAGQRVVANYSRNAERAEAFAKTWSIPEATTKLDRLIARGDIDLYVIALPNEEHLGVSLKLSKAKRIRSARSRSREHAQRQRR